MEGDRISVGNLDGGSHICRKPRSGGGENPIPTGSQMWDPKSAGSLYGEGGFPISAENLDGGSHTYRKSDV